MIVNATRLSATGGNILFGAKPIIRSVAFVGSSSVEQMFSPNTTAGTNRFFSGNGFPVWCCAALKQRIMATHNPTNNTYDFATFGFLNTQILGTHVPEVITAAPDAAVLYCGNNDVGTGLSGATVWNSLLDIITPIRNAGIIPIVMLVGPRASTAGGGAGYWARQIATNDAIIAGLTSLGLPYFDPNISLQNPLTGEPLPGVMQGDGTHINTYGASRLGQSLATWLSANYNLSPAPLTPARIATLAGVNPTMTGGTTLATGYSVFSGARHVNSKVTKDGKTWQQLVHSPNARTDPSQLNTATTTITLPAGWAGNRVRLWLEMEFDRKADWATSPGYAAYQIDAFATVNGTGGQTMNVIRSGNDPGATYAVDIPASGVYVAPVMDVPANATTLAMTISVLGGGTYRYTSWGGEIVSGYKPPAINS
jgi:hypothetical protein